MTAGSAFVKILIGACLALATIPMPAPAMGPIDLSPVLQQWVARYDGSIGTTGSDDRASAIAVSPDGERLYVTGTSHEDSAYYEFTTLAYDTATGVRLWTAHYTGASSSDTARDIKVSPDGARVYVTGASTVGCCAVDIATVAYDASTGAQLWVARVGARESIYIEQPWPRLGISPDGGTVFVAGSSPWYPIGNNDFLVIAYDSQNGKQLWTSRYHGPGSGENTVRALGTSPDGALVYVTGSSVGSNDVDIATVAFDAVTGVQAWVSRYDGSSLAGATQDWPAGLDIAPDGNRLYVTGTSDPADSGAPSRGSEFATVAYDASTGGQVWATRKPASVPKPFGNDAAAAVRVSPDGSRVFVTGTTSKGTGTAYETIAYESGTGLPLWSAAYAGGFPSPLAQTEKAIALAVSPDGGRVYVTGWSAGLGFELGTVAYDATGGLELWAARCHCNGGASAVAVSTSGGQVFVAGVGDLNGPSSNYVTVAYCALDGSLCQAGNFNSDGLT
jgi:WD40 repeat protein